MTTITPEMLAALQNSPLFAEVLAAAKDNFWDYPTENVAAAGEPLRFEPREAFRAADATLRRTLISVESILMFVGELIRATKVANEHQERQVGGLWAEIFVTLGIEFMEAALLADPHIRTENDERSRRNLEGESSTKPNQWWISGPRT